MKLIKPDPKTTVKLVCDDCKTDQMIFWKNNKNLVWASCANCGRVKWECFVTEEAELVKKKLPLN